MGEMKMEERIRIFEKEIIVRVKCEVLPSTIVEDNISNEEVEHFKHIVHGGIWMSILENIDVQIAKCEMWDDGEWNVIHHRAINNVVDSDYIHEFTFQRVE